MNDYDGLVVSFKDPKTNAALANIRRAKGALAGTNVKYYNKDGSETEEYKQLKANNSSSALSRGNVVIPATSSGGSAEGSVASENAVKELLKVATNSKQPICGPFDVGCK